MVVRDWNINDNFWRLHPEIKAIEPFHSFYYQDNTKDRQLSSSEMWGMALVVDYESPYRTYNDIDRIAVVETDIFKSVGKFERNKDKWQPIIAAYNKLQEESVYKHLYLFNKHSQILLDKIDGIMSNAETTIAQISSISTLRNTLLKHMSDYDKINTKIQQYKLNKSIVGNRGSHQASGLEEDEE